MSSSKSRMDSKHRMDETVPDYPSADWNLCTPIRQGGDAAMNIGKAALMVGDAAQVAALKVGDAALKTGDAALMVASFTTCARSATYAAVAFFTISTLQPISKYLVFTAVTGAALLPFPAFWRFLEKVLRASVSAIINLKVLLRGTSPASPSTSPESPVPVQQAPVPVQQAPVTESRSSTAAVEEVRLTQRGPAQGSGPSGGGKSGKQAGH
eukprot:CAMPEP_0172171524 /NCGR_PEP_ID=MMETSP1050-20130122/11940_1 /TAXON_ID=233186 /ORGANISM="Cryptomonas curvata, Strain CCAP979/52" /LENGTH=210 /DNA_ID=CAMNT_0012842965 /DNA_START=215 /DNA_END=847 /DNA_ORIENTATION=+